MKTILAVGLMMVAGAASAATFNPASGVGSLSQAEVCAAMGWTAAQYMAASTGNAPGPTLAITERYTITVQYVNGAGATVSQTQTRDVSGSRRVPAAFAGANVNLPGYAAQPYLSTLAVMGRVPQVGDGNYAAEGGEFFPGNGGILPPRSGTVRGGTITNVTLTTQSQRLFLNGVQVYP